jgi:hypothetical protein
MRLGPPPVPTARKQRCPLRSASQGRSVALSCRRVASPPRLAPLALPQFVHGSSLPHASHQAAQALRNRASSSIHQPSICPRLQLVPDPPVGREPWSSFPSSTCSSAASKQVNNDKPLNPHLQVAHARLQQHVRRHKGASLHATRKEGLRNKKPARRVMGPWCGARSGYADGRCGAPGRTAATSWSVVGARPFVTQWPNLLPASGIQTHACAVLPRRPVCCPSPIIMRFDPYVPYEARLVKITPRRMTSAPAVRCGRWVLAPASRPGCSRAARAWWRRPAAATAPLQGRVFPCQWLGYGGGGGKSCERQEERAVGWSWAATRQRGSRNGAGPAPLLGASGTEETKTARRLRRRGTAPVAGKAGRVVFALATNDTDTATVRALPWPTADEGGVGLRALAHAEHGVAHAPRHLPGGPAAAGGAAAAGADGRRR